VKNVFTLTGTLEALHVSAGYLFARIPPGSHKTLLNAGTLCREKGVGTKASKRLVIGLQLGIA
jgi:hypothetical protein